jgi:glycosyltransferase involved in cell wall biosynthesis
MFAHPLPSGREPMRVLLLDHTSLVSGAQRALIETVVGAGSEAEFEVLCPPGPLAEELIANGVLVHPFPGTAGSLRLHPLRTPRAIYDMAISARVLSRVAKSRGADVIHANSIRAGLIAVMARAFGAPAPIVHIHDCLPPTVTARIVREILLRGSRGLIAVSMYAADAFRTRRSREPIEVLYNPVDLTRFDADAWPPATARAQAGLPPDAPLVGVIAQITPWKGQDTVLRAFARVVAEFPSAQLLFVGETKFVGPDVRFDNRAFKAELERLVEVLGLHESVTFMGERRDIPALAAALDVIAMPSHEEPLGRAAMEGLAMGTPVIATSIGGAAEVVRDGIDGFVVPPRDPDAWAAAITALLGDHDLRDRLGRNGRQRVQQFEQRRYLRRLLQTYEKALDGDRRRLDVLFVDHTAEIGGAQKSLLELIAHLPPELATAVACPPGGLSRAAREEGARTFEISSADVGTRFGLRHTPAALWSAARAALGVRRLARALSPSVIHANSTRAGVISLLAKSESTALIVHLRDVTGLSPLARLARGLVLRGANVVVANSGHTMRSFGPVSETRAVVIHNGVDTGHFSPATVSRSAARAALGFEEDVPVLLMVAQITPWKRQDHAIRLLSRVRKSQPSATLLLAGSAKFVGPTTSYDNRAYLASLQALCAELGVQSSVRFLGEVDDVRPLLAACDVALLPSTEEPFGRTVVEAMAMGRPVVATSIGGPQEIIDDGVSGFLADPSDLDQWEHIVLRVLADRALADRLGQAGRAHALSALTAEHHAEQVCAVYARLDRIRSSRGGVARV